MQALRRFEFIDVLARGRSLLNVDLLLFLGREARFPLDYHPRRLASRHFRQDARFPAVAGLQA